MNALSCVGTGAALDALNAEVDQALRNFLDTYPATPFYDAMRLQLGWVGHAPAPRPPSPTPLICLLVCQAAGGEPRKAMPAAIGLALLYNFSVIQSDVEDQRPSRGGRPTVWAVWGTAQAMNVADGMHTLAKIAAHETRRLGMADGVAAWLTALVDETCLRLCEARYLELTAPEVADSGGPGIDPGSVATPTAVLWAAAAAAGATLGGAEHRVCEAYRRFGHFAGLAQDRAATPHAGAHRFRGLALAALEECIPAAPASQTLRELVGLSAAVRVAG
ncbi:MAG: polyprenyl synthetase family protein [Chloroflexota bacterium]